MRTTGRAIYDEDAHVRGDLAAAVAMAMDRTKKYRTWMPCSQTLIVEPEHATFIKTIEG